MWGLRSLGGRGCFNSTFKLYIFYVAQAATGLVLFFSQKKYTKKVAAEKF